ncbi:hypothetical protein K488DRAFT_85676 [Vararia minispora EC-137]|uniref:Uncharacterized protein n=1 Tax=Vararia minispora EC-137 TaxID=1314806 RepID=A0ACB8QLD0_9AGAM|nr:hypothetical protein K488DRAFT_85676 [Vararia minispora EC-137]
MGRKYFFRKRGVWGSRDGIFSISVPENLHEPFRKVTTTPLDSYYTHDPFASLSADLSHAFEAVFEDVSKSVGDELTGEVQRSIDQARRLVVEALFTLISDLAVARQDQAAELQFVLPIGVINSRVEGVYVFVLTLKEPGSPARQKVWRIFLSYH